MSASATIAGKMGCVESVTLTGGKDVSAATGSGANLCACSDVRVDKLGWTGKSPAYQYLIARIVPKNPPSGDCVGDKTCAPTSSGAIFSRTFART